MTWWARGSAPRGAEVLFVSSERWDICSGAAYGFRTLWVNRAGAPMDRLHGAPGHVARDLRALPNLIGGAVTCRFSPPQMAQSCIIPTKAMAGALICLAGADAQRQRFRTILRRICRPCD